MMISPETFYDMELAGKSIREIKKVICSLQQEMSHLIKTMEMPGYRPMMFPTESNRLACARDYLARAKEELEAAGGVYKPTKAELLAEEFDDNIPYIEKIVYSTTGLFDGSRVYTMDLTKDVLHLEADLQIIGKGEEEEEYEIEKEEFLIALYELHIGEWQNEYDPQRYGCAVFDGVQWKLEITYKNGRKTWVVQGDNIWPHNFDGFLWLMGIEIPKDVFIERCL